jgi:membrane protein implicated in regulation of membrane protease activity
MSDQPDQGRCRKCQSTINASAKRCPECGYEPSTGWLLRIVAALAAVLAVFAVPSAPLALVSPLISGVTVTEAAIGVVSWTAIALVCLWVLRKWWHQRNRTVSYTTQTNDG